MIYTTQLEIAKQAEISKRLSGLIQHVIQFVPADQQSNILSAMERAKNVAPQVGFFNFLKVIQHCF
jgi:hypothetical protein